MCQCNNQCGCQQQTCQLTPLYFKTTSTGEVAIYATIQPQKNCMVPYWCNNLSAYNDAPPTGCMSLSDPALRLALPVSAKHSPRLLYDDLVAGSVKPLEYYGTVLNVNGKVIKYDPALMTGSVTMMPKADFIKAVSCVPPTTATQQPAAGTPAGNTGIVPPNLLNQLDQAEQKVQQYHGLLLMMFGVGALISLK